MLRKTDHFPVFKKNPLPKFMEGLIENVSKHNFDMCAVASMSNLSLNSFAWTYRIMHTEKQIEY